MRPLLTGIYTLTPTHCGTGQARHDIDLPIAREATTGLPILPATSLKGAARAAFERQRHPYVVGLFGPEIGAAGEVGHEDGLRAGALSLGEGQLLVYPFRGLRPPLAFATCPLILERLARALRARAELRSHPILQALTGASWDATTKDRAALKTLVGRQPTGPLVIEDRVIQQSDLVMSDLVNRLGHTLGELLPDDEGPTRTRLATDLVVLPDHLFLELIGRVTPVQARVKLTSAKTTGTYDGEKGNLWSEESLPSDCLFWCLIEARPGWGGAGLDDPADVLFPKSRKAEDVGPDMTTIMRATQIGGNETVGQGLCLWTVRRPT